MKKIFTILMSVILISIVCPIVMAIDYPSIMDDADLITGENLTTAENRIEAIEQTYDYSVTLISITNYSETDQFNTYVNTFDQYDSAEDGIVFFIGIRDFGYDYDYYAYGNFSTDLNSQMPSNLDTLDSNTATYWSFYNGFLNLVEDYLYDRTGIEIDHDTNIDTAVSTELISGFDPLIDSANLLTDTQEADLFARIKEINEDYNFDVTFLTMDYVPTRDDLLTYTDWYTGLDYTRDGVVFAINMDPNNRGYATSTRNYAQTAFSSDALDLIDSNIRPMLTDANYYLALDLYLDYTIDFLDAANSGAVYSSPMGLDSLLLIIFAPLVIAIIIALIVVKSVFVKPMKTAEIQTVARDYLKLETLNLRNSSDVYINTTVTRVLRETSNNSGGGGSRSGYGGSRGGRSGGF